MTHLCSDRVTHTKNTICPRARKTAGRYHPRRRRAACLSIIRLGERNVFGFQDEIRTNTRTTEVAATAALGICRRANSRLPAENVYLFTGGAGSLLASKVGSFLASAEAKTRLACGSARRFTPWNSCLSPTLCGRRRRRRSKRTVAGIGAALSVRSRHD